MEALKISISEQRGGLYLVSFRDPIVQRRKRKYFNTITEAEEFKQKLVVLYHQGRLSTETTYVGHLVQAYLTKFPSSRFTDRKNTFVSFCNHFGHFPLAALTKTSLVVWFEKIQKENNYTEKNMARLKVQINHFFRFLMDEGIIKDNPLALINFKQHLAPVKSRVLLSEDEIKQILEWAKEFSPDLLYAYIYIAIHTGARQGEILKLKWNYVDFETGIINLRKTKNGTDRAIKMSNSLYRFLLNFPRNSDYVLNKRQCERLDLFYLRREIIKFQKRYPNQKQWRTHDLRHSFCYNALLKGKKMYQLQSILGHRSVQLTIDLYGHLKSISIDDPSPFDF